MLTFQIASDLHIETNLETPSALSYVTPCADYLILAGDIGRIHKFHQLSEFLTELCSYFVKVIYIPGNHEYYEESGYEDKSMGQLFQQLKRIDIPNLHILSRDVLIIEDVCIAGCTLWTQADAYTSNIVRVFGLNKFKYNALHQADVEFISKSIEYAQKNRYKLLLVTHHCPSHSLVNRAFRDRYWSLYSSDLDRFMTRDQVHTWVFGHTHFNRDIVTDLGTHVLSNQRGKKRGKIHTYELTKTIQL